MMAHTPGPWKQLEYDDWLYIGGDDMDLIEYDPVNEPYNCEVQNAVCVIGRVDDMTERDEANAALIAAAPDMAARIERLETEKAAIAEIADHLKNILHVWTRYPGRMDDIRWDVEKIAAIAKAEEAE